MKCYVQRYSYMNQNWNSWTFFLLLFWCPFAILRIKVVIICMDVRKNKLSNRPAQENITIFLMSILTSTDNWTLLFNKYTVIFTVIFNCFTNTMLCNGQFLKIEETFHSSFLWILLSLKKEKICIYITMQISMLTS